MPLPSVEPGWGAQDSPVHYGKDAMKIKTKRNPGAVFGEMGGMTLLSLESGIRLEVRGDHPLAALAARVLARHLGIATRADAPLIVLDCGQAVAPEDEAFSWDATSQRVVLSGAGPRGLLWAAFAFIEACGFIFPAPGIVHTPPSGDVRIPRRHHGAPKLAGRSLIIGHAAFMAEVEDWIHFAAANRLNTIFFHTDEHGLGLGAIPGKIWQARKAAAIALARAYGMTLELGGHGLVALLPREHFAHHPDWFRMKDGVRVADHNLNPLSQGALDELCRNARAWFAANRGFDVYHLWADDLPDGGWCAEAARAGYSPSDQMMLVTNALARVLAEIAPGARLSYLAYHDTEKAPARVAPLPNVAITFAPRLRSYAAPVVSDHPVNRTYGELIAANAAHMGEEAARGGLRVFEYYLDAILFKLMVPPLLDVMAEDLATYHRLGAHSVGALLTGAAPFRVPSINAFGFARLSWNPAWPLDRIRSDFARATFPGLRDGISHFAGLEEALRPALDMAPDEVRLRHRRALEDMLDDPPGDVGDPSNASPERAAELSVLMAEVVDHLTELRGQSGVMLDDTIPFALGWATLRRDWYGLEALRAQRHPSDAERAVIARGARALVDAIEALPDQMAKAGHARVWCDNAHALLFIFWGLHLLKIERDALPAHERAAHRTATRDQAVAVFTRIAALWNEFR